MVLLSGVATSVGGSSWRGRRPVTMASPAGAGSELSVVSTVVVSDTVDSGASGSVAVVPGSVVVEVVPGSVVVEVVSDVVGWVVLGTAEGVVVVVASISLRRMGEPSMVASPWKMSKMSSISLPRRSGINTAFPATVRPVAVI